MIEIDTNIIEYSYGRDVYGMESGNHWVSVIDPYYTKIMTRWCVEENDIRIKTNFEI